MLRLTAILLLLGTLSPLSATAQQIFERGASINTSCVGLVGLVTVLEKIVNEQQLLNNSSDIFRGQGDCTLVPGREHTSKRDVAKINNIAGADQVGFVGWIITERWYVPVERIAYLDRAKELAWRPAGIFSRKAFVLPKKCILETNTTIAGVKIYGHQLADFGRRHCRVPGLG